ncbi:hypothetical protein [Pectobacterium sp. B1J-3]|uniref:hypothetical protein n=1 Tax=Pectobacterium sp. B1J-3 TaxID=3385371 RepID=UPI003905E97B
MCTCIQRPEVMDISNHYADITATLKPLAAANWLLLMQCPDCLQLYSVDEWDKYLPCYAVKIADQHRWQQFDRTSLIKNYIIQQHNGLGSKPCIWAGCDIRQVKGSMYCIHHLYDNMAENK